MRTFAVLATGQSLTEDQITAVRHLPCVAVSDAYARVPWAVAMVSQDAAWWKVHPEAKAFFGRKYSGNGVAGTEKVEYEGLINSGTNSGLLACHIAVTLGADRLILLGFDLHGTHYFGPHPSSLRNTQPHRFMQMQQQFARWRAGVEVINCTPGTALTCFPIMDLHACLAELAE